MMENVENVLDDILSRRTLIAAVLSGPRERREEDYRKVQVKPVVVKGDWLCQFEYHYDRKVAHRNLPPDAAKAHLLELLGDRFKQGQVFTEDADYHLLVNRKGEATVGRRPPSRAAKADVRHDRKKNYLLEAGRPIDFLIRLGVMNKQGRVAAGKYDKFRQINRFLEMVEDVADRLPDTGQVRVIDFGCGKSYLTFALYHYLREIRGLDARIVGLDLKRDVVDGCCRIASDLGYEALDFAVGDIAGYEGTERADLVVSLHACDTATDDALAQAVRWEAKVILAVPCCQHELFRQVRSEVLRPLLKHGIFKERVSALVTDALRASLLEVCGYSVQVLEFIETEHTPKNLLIRAVRQEHPPPRHNVLREYRAFRDFWDVRPYLERALEDRLPDLTAAAPERPHPTRGSQDG